MEKRNFSFFIQSNHFTIWLITRSICDYVVHHHLHHMRFFTDLKEGLSYIRNHIFLVRFFIKLVGQSQIEDRNPPSTLKELIKKPHILREEGSGTRKTVLEYLKKHDIELSQINLSAALGSTKSTVTAVEVGLGLSWISEHAIEDALKLNKIKIIEDQYDIERNFYIITRKKKTLNPLAQAFKNYLVQNFFY